MTRMQENLVATAMWVLLLLALGYFVGDAEAWEVQQPNGRRFTCVEVAQLVEAMEALPERERVAHAADWKVRLASQVDVGFLVLFDRAELYLKAGYGSKEAWADCPVI